MVKSQALQQDIVDAINTEKLKSKCPWSQLVSALSAVSTDEATV
jgi:hypothetical protein